MHQPHPDRFGPTAVKSIALWLSVGGVVLVAFLLLFPTSSPSSATRTTKASVPAANEPPGVAKAREVFNQRCTVCHGPTGQGDGPASAGLNPRPRRLSDPTWQASVTDAHIENVIKFGGAAVGKSPAMPSNPDLQSDTQVISGLRVVVRELKQ